MKFTLTVFLDGRALLTSEDDLTVNEYEQIKATWDQWKDSPDGLAVISRCSVQHVESVEIELPMAV